MRSRLVRERKGMTLVELGMVVTLIGIISGMAYPKMAPAVASSEVRSAKAEVVSYLARARQAAIQRGMQVSFVRIGNTVAVVADSAGTTIRFGNDLDLASSRGVTVGATQNVIRFDSRGFAMNLTGPVTVSLTHGSSTASVCVMRLGNILTEECS